MPGIGFDIGKLFDAAFGITPVYKMPGSPDKSGYVGELKEVEVDRESQLGTPIVGTITFEGGNYFVYTEDGDVKSVSYKTFELPVAVLASVRRAKVMKRTGATGSKGSNKEIYGFSDWIVTIMGVALPDSSQPQGLVNPLDQINELYKWEKVVDSIRISGGLYINREIHNIVIEELDVRQLKGRPKAIPFMIRAISDEPKELS